MHQDRGLLCRCGEIPTCLFLPWHCIPYLAAGTRYQSAWLVRGIDSLLVGTELGGDATVCKIIRVTSCEKHDMGSRSHSRLMDCTTRKGSGMHTSAGRLWYKKVSTRTMSHTVTRARTHAPKQIRISTGISQIWIRNHLIQKHSNG